MNPLLPLTLATAIVLSLGGCAAVPSAAPALSANQVQVSYKDNCRRLASPEDNVIRTYCGTDEKWAEFDARAATNGVTCQSASSRNSLPRLCLTAANWALYKENMAAYRKRRSAASAPSWTSSSSPPVENSASYATSYGFSSTGVIGQ